MKQLSLRKRFDNLYACIEVCLSNLSEQESLPMFCRVLSIEAQALGSKLSKLLEQYEKTLPIRLEEPEDVVWRNESDRLQKLLDELNLPSVLEFPCDLTDGDLCGVIGYIDQIDKALSPEDDADKYAEYSKRELDSYYSNQWSDDQRVLREEINQQPSAHKSLFCEEQKAMWLERLKEHARYAVDVAQSFNKFYNENQILVEDEKVKNTRLAIVAAVKFTLKNALALLGIAAPEQM